MSFFYLICELDDYEYFLSYLLVFYLLGVQNKSGHLQLGFFILLFWISLWSYLYP